MHVHIPVAVYLSFSLLQGPVVAVAIDDASLQRNFVAPGPSWCASHT